MTSSSALDARGSSHHYLWLLLDFLAVVGFMVVVFIASSAPSIVPLHFGVWQFDKVAHFSAFLVFGVCLCRFVYRLSGSFFWAVWIACVVGSLYGISDELHQAHVPGRFADVYDIYADILGSATGAFLWLYVKRR